MSPEAFVRPIPNSANTSQERHHIVLSVNSLPASYIEEVFPNSAARDVLPRTLQFLSSTGYLQQNVVMVTGDYHPSRTTRLIHRGWGRAVPVAGGCIPYAESIVGSVVSGKGSSASGFIYEDTYRSDTNQMITPWGFFGVKDAAYDVEASNYLLAVGFRSALDLGYVVLKPNAIEWLTSQYQNPTQKEYLRKMWRIVYENNDTPAYLLRVQGVPSRIGVTVAGHRTQAPWAAKLHLAESQMFPEQWKRYFLNNHEASAAIGALKQIASRHALTWGESHAYLSFMTGIWARNQQALLGVDRALHPEMNAMRLSEPKDIDMAHITCDYEEMRGHKLLFSDLHSYLHLTHQYLTDMRLFLSSIQAVSISSEQADKYIVNRLNTLVKAWDIPVAQIHMH